MSNYGTSVARLYEFSLGTRVWRYAGYDEDVEVGGRLFKSVRGGILDSGISYTESAEQDNLEITASRDVEVGRLFEGTPPGEDIWITIFEYTQGDTTTRTLWIGYVSSVSILDGGQYKITGFTLSASMQRTGLRLSWSRGCHHVLYGPRCRVNPEPFRVVGVVDSIAGITLTVPDASSRPDGWFSGGFMEWERLPGVIDRRPIELHSGSTITLMALTDGITVGAQVNLYPGCDRTIGTCSWKFNNHLNYGGDPNMAGDSPFDGNRVW